MKNNIVYFGGFGKMFWWNIREPNIDGRCNCVTACALDEDMQGMTVLQQLEGIHNPSSLCLSPDGKYLYAANSTNNFLSNGYGGGVSAFAVDSESGCLRLLNQSLSYGSCTCKVATDNRGEYLFAVNHGSYYYCSRYAEKDGVLVPEVIRDEGCICLFRLESDGSIGALKDRLVFSGSGEDPIFHASSHPHSVIVADDDRIIVPDKGGDSIYLCSFDREKEKLHMDHCLKTEPGSSPRWGLACRGTPYVLIVNEYDARLCSYRIKGKELERVDSVRLCSEESHVAEGDKVYGGSIWGIELQAKADHSLLYANNSANELLTFAFDSQSGSISLKNCLKMKGKGSSRGLTLGKEDRLLLVCFPMADEAAVFDISDEGIPVEKYRVELPSPTSSVFL